MGDFVSPSKAKSSKCAHSAQSNIQRAARNLSVCGYVGGYKMFCKPPFAVEGREYATCVLAESPNVYRRLVFSNLFKNLCRKGTLVLCSFIFVMELTNTNIE